MTSPEGQDPAMNDQQPHTPDPAASPEAAMHSTARRRAAELTQAALTEDVPEIKTLMFDLSTDRDIRATSTTVVVLAAMAARMARALADGDPQRTQQMIEDAISDEIDHNAPRGDA